MLFVCPTCDRSTSARPQVPCRFCAGTAKSTLKSAKICSCGRAHYLVPASAKYLNDDSELNGWYWNCACDSTLFEAEDRREYAASDEDAEADLGDQMRKSEIEEALVAS